MVARDLWQYTHRAQGHSPRARCGLRWNYQYCMYPQTKCKKCNFQSYNYTDTDPKGSLFEYASTIPSPASQPPKVPTVRLLVYNYTYILSSEVPYN